jgi:hypothetical protein
MRGSPYARVASVSLPAGKRKIKGQGTGAGDGVRAASAQGVCGWRGERWQGSPVVWVNLP